MIDETNRATAGVTDAPEPEPGEASGIAPGTEPPAGEEAQASSSAVADLPAGEEAQASSSAVADLPATEEPPADAGATDTTADAAATAPAPSSVAEATAPERAQPSSDARQANEPPAEAPARDAPVADAIPADEARADEASVAAISVEQGPLTVEPEAEAQGDDADDGEPMTMAQLMEIPDNEVKSLKHGDVVEGTVVRIDPDEILVDFGGKSEGVVSNRELMSRRGPRDGRDGRDGRDNRDGREAREPREPREGRETDESRPELSVGDEVLVYVLQPESPEGHAVLSLRRAGLERKWRGMQERFDAGEIVEARVIDHNKGGLIVDLGVRGFVPISQIVDFPRRPRDEQPRDAAQEIAEKLQPFVGRTLRLKILEVNRKANRLILSEKVALYEERREKRDELFSSLHVGQRVTGVVRSIAPFGVFVDLGGIDGLVHKSELSWNKVNNPENAYQIGEEVEAEVIDINHERGRISLSIRRLQADPWQESVAKYKIGDVIDGTVTKLVNFGAFVRVEEGLEGLIHISELSNQRVAHPGDVVQEGQQVKLRIISLDSERHRLGLSLKQAEDRPAPAPREERPRRERTSSNRRDRVDYRPEDATAEPEGGIDSTMAAAFASSGLLDQFRTEEAADATSPEPEPEPVVAQAPEAIVDGPAPDATALEDDLRGTDAAAADAPTPPPAAKGRRAKAQPVADEPGDAGATDGADAAESAKPADAAESVKRDAAESAKPAEAAEAPEATEENGS